MILKNLLVQLIFIKRIFITVLLLLSIVVAKSQTFTVNGIGYSDISGTNALAWGASGFSGGLTIPATVTNSGTTYTVTGLRAYFVTKFNGSNCTSITVSEGIKTLVAGQNGSFDLAGNSYGANITSISLPSSLTISSLGDYTFTGYPALTSFSIACSTPPTISANCFYNVPLSKVTLHLPVGTKTAYQNAGWTGFGSIIEDIGVANATVPDAPVIASVTSGDSQAIISFSTPNNGGLPITAYTVTSSPGNFTQTSPASPVYVTGLTNGTAYTFTVVATNAKGNSVPSTASGSVIPVSSRVLASSSCQLLSISQTSKTDLHILSSVDSMKYSAGTNQIIIYKKNNITYSYNFSAIDSIGLFPGSFWQDSLKVAYDVRRYGVVGDGTTNNKTNLDNAISAARSGGANLFFPNGTYLYKGGMNAQNIRLIGQSRSSTILKDITVTNEHNMDGAENITLQDFYVTDYNTTLIRIFKNTVFKVSLTVPTSYIQVYSGVYTYGAEASFIDCDFIYPSIWVGLFIRKYHSVLVRNCYFNGNATHNIRLQEPNIATPQVSILNNTIFGGTTGIFLTSNQSMPLVGGLIQGNKLFSQQEESIAMDGFGNDSGVIPVITNGQLSSASNDANGRLVVGMDKMLKSDSTVATVSARTDWKNFYFAFGAGTGLDGKYVKIYDYNVSANTITVDTIVSSTKITLTGDAGVESGFFNWNIIGNSVSGTLGSGNTYGTAISAYLNVFGLNIQDNVVTNCAHGINVAGGNMIKTSRTFAWHNYVKNNTFTDCDRYGVGQPSEDLGAIRVLSYFSATGPLQFDNKFINNTVNGGRVYIERQRNFVETGNLYNNVTRLAVDTQ